MLLPGADSRTLNDDRAVAEAAAQFILDRASASVRERGRFRIVLAGGTTPTACYRLLAQGSADWARWHVYHGDERCLPAADPRRNSLAADQAWLRHVPIPRPQVHAIPAEQGAEAAAEQYAAVIRDALPFDLVLLGIGEDGHTASLFPGRTVADQALVVAVHDAPKPPPDRVSLTPLALRQSERILVLVTGAGKHAALRRWQHGEALPITEVAAGGETLVLLDRAAAGA
jgi:6-phosphogluconolactonase